MEDKEYLTSYILDIGDITVGDLYDYLENHIKRYGRDGEVWLQSGIGTSSPCNYAIRLNCSDSESDVVLEWNRYGDLEN